MDPSRDLTGKFERIFGIPGNCILLLATGPGIHGLKKKILWGKDYVLSRSLLQPSRPQNPYANFQTDRHTFP